MRYAQTPKGFPSRGESLKQNREGVIKRDGRLVSYVKEEETHYHFKTTPPVTDHNHSSTLFTFSENQTKRCDLLKGITRSKYLLKKIKLLFIFHFAVVSIRYTEVHAD